MFPICCHHALSTSTVTLQSRELVPTGDNIGVICEECFQKNDMKWAREEALRAIRNNELDCCECGTSPARWFEDLAAGMCEDCRVNMYREEKGFFSAYDNFSDCPVKIPDEIIPGLLYLGSVNSAANKFSLEAYRIRHILICATFLPAYHRADSSFVYHRLPLSDSIDEDIVRYLPDACRFIDHCKEINEPVLVHCQAGVSRSASICIAYLMKSQGLSFTEALISVREKRPFVCPNDKFIEDLKGEWAEQVEASSTEQK